MRYNLIGNIIKYTYPEDDSSGGAVPSGTVLYENVQLRFHAQQPTQVLLEQGLETETLFSISAHPATMDVEHNYEIEITAPTYSWYYQKRFRIIGVQPPSMNRKHARSFLSLTAKREEKSHAIQ